MKRQIELSNEAAAALNDQHGAMLAELERHVAAGVHVRGNLVTLDGDEAAVSEAATKVEELAALVDSGHELLPGTVGAVADAVDRETSPAAMLGDVVGRHRSTTVAPPGMSTKKPISSARPVWM